MLIPDHRIRILMLSKNFMGFCLSQWMSLQAWHHEILAAFLFVLVRRGLGNPWGPRCMREIIGHNHLDAISTRSSDGVQNKGMSICNYTNMRCSFTTSYPCSRSQTHSQVWSQVNWCPTSLIFHYKINSDIPWVKVDNDHFTNPLLIVT